MTDAASSVSAQHSDEKWPQPHGAPSCTASVPAGLELAGSRRKVCRSLNWFQLRGVRRCAPF